MQNPKVKNKICYFTIEEIAKGEQKPDTGVVSTHDRGVNTTR
ncbi:hypothetical protein SLEP1_g40057 [Rubroshorea leprosula]|uniref:Uncharacterized protein n=1 Tax=Rubroshorea leprosula TaxID=152421 RepID=A0AAV5L348_9ROSI|nr:hypothetical protein SLEP1_g40057 [Rubroshorea leprosula]